MIKFSRFLDIMENPDLEQGIFYIQKQNSNLTEEFPELLEQVTVHLPNKLPVDKTYLLTCHL